MDNAIVNVNIIGYKNDPNKDFESPKEDCLAKRGDVSPSSIKRLQISDFCAQNHFFQQLSGLNKLIPKQIMTVEEKYLRRCLELIHTSAMTANSWPISSSRVVGGGNGGRDALFLFSSGNENLVMSSSVDPIVGSITGSPTMINLLNSPLLRQLGASDDYISNGNASAIEVRESICADSSHEIEKKRVLPEDQIFGCSPVHKRLVSHSSTYSTFSDPSTSSSSSSSSSSSGYCQGMLHCSRYATVKSFSTAKGRLDFDGSEMTASDVPTFLSKMVCLTWFLTAVAGPNSVTSMKSVTKCVKVFSPVKSRKSTKSSYET